MDVTLALDTINFFWIRVFRLLPSTSQADLKFVSWLSWIQNYDRSRFITCFRDGFFHFQNHKFFFLIEATIHQLELSSKSDYFSGNLGTDHHPVNINIPINFVPIIGHRVYLELPRDLQIIANCALKRAFCHILGGRGGIWSRHRRAYIRSLNFKDSETKKKCQTKIIQKVCVTT